SGVSTSVGMAQMVLVAHQCVWRNDWYSRGIPRRLYRLVRVRCDIPERLTELGSTHCGHKPGRYRARIRGPRPVSLLGRIWHNFWSWLDRDTPHDTFDAARIDDRFAKVLSRCPSDRLLGSCGSRASVRGTGVN